MASGFDLLVHLVQQTRLGNITWMRGAHPTEYVWASVNGSVVLTSMNGDGQAPFGVAVLDVNGDMDSFWQVDPQSPPDEETFDDLVRELWSLVSDQSSVVTRMVEDLRTMPPF